MVLFLATSGAVLAANEAAQTPKLLLARIRVEGAATVVRSLWDTPRWSELTNQVASGDPDWVSVAMAISKGSDAGATEELADALFVALGQNPTYILRVLPTEESDAVPLALSGVCSGRTDPLGTYAASIAEQRAAEAAVEKVTVPTLKPKKRQCLAKLKAGEADLKRFFGVS
jgi:hypothetical protein